MKVLHCLAQLPQNTGSGVYFSNVINGLEKRGFENYAMYGVQEPFNIEFHGNIKKYPVVFNSEELPFPIVGMSDEMPYPSTVYSEMTEDMYDKWLAAFRAKLLEIKGELKPDVIITHHLFILSSLVREIFPETFIIGVSHGTDIRQIKRNPWIKDKYIHHIQDIDLFFTIGPYDAEDIEKEFSIDKNRIKFMGGGFNQEVFYPGENRREGINLVFAGKICKSKGVYELAQALPIVGEKYPVTLDIIGDVSPEEERELRERSGNYPGLEIYNTLNQKEMADILRTCQVFLLPSYYEALGLIAIEALACRVRVVATEIDGLMYVLGDKVQESGVIEYVEMPRIYDLDKPVEEDIPDFVARLAEGIITQIERVQADEPVEEEVKDLIDCHSWDNITGEMAELLRTLKV